MTSKSEKHKSKFLSLILRHKPEEIDLHLDKNGWAFIEELISKSKKKGVPISLIEIKQIVITSDKQRFKISEDGLRIRANQGHSINIDLELNPMEPPDKLYHGTATKNKTSIMDEGIVKGSRLHVHLSEDVETATKVGQRHGKPIIFSVEARKMHMNGHVFYQSENGVWLVDHVGPKYLELLKE